MGQSLSIEMMSGADKGRKSCQCPLNKIVPDIPQQQTYSKNLL